MKNLELKIEKSTLRELNNNEVAQVAGGAGLFTVFISPRLTSSNDDDVIFDDGFDEQP